MLNFSFEYHIILVKKIYNKFKNWRANNFIASQYLTYKVQLWKKKKNVTNFFFLEQENKIKIFQQLNTTTMHLKWKGVDRAQTHGHLVVSRYLYLLQTIEDLFVLVCYFRYGLLMLVKGGAKTMAFQSARPVTGLWTTSWPSVFHKETNKDLG